MNWLYDEDCIEEIDSINFEIWHRNEISVNEFRLLYAWYTIKAIERIEEVYGENKANQIKKDFREIFSWQNVFGKFSMLDIENHLKKVCDYHNKQYKFPYKWEWLLYFDETLYERLIVNKDYFPYAKKGQKEAKATVGAIEEI